MRKKISSHNGKKKVSPPAKKSGRRGFAENNYLTHALPKSKLMEAAISPAQIRKHENIESAIWLIPLRDEKTGKYFEPARMKLKFLNELTEDILGFTPEEYAKKPLAEFFTPESFDLISRLLAKELKRDKEPGVDPDRIVETELKHYHKNGAIVDIFVRIQATRNKHGQITGLKGTSRDITSRRKIQQELEASHERYRELAELLPGSVFECDKNFIVTFLNKKAMSAFGYGESDVKQGLNILKAVSLNDITRAIEYVSHLCADNSLAFQGIELTGVKKSKENFPIKLYGDLICHNSRIIGMRGIAIDITEQKEKENSLRQSEERYRTIIEDIEDGYYEVDLEGNLTYFNDAALRITGYLREEMFGVNFRKFCKLGTRKYIFHAFRNVYVTRQTLHGFEWEIKTKKGETRIGEISASLIEDASGRTIGFRGIMRDVTERRKAEELIKQLAYHDFLTGLPNRRLFNDRLSMAMNYVDRNKSMLAIMMIDLDNFKQVNDTLGHQVGDDLLKVVAKRLCDLVRKSDTVARMGGDEFLMLLMTDIITQQDISNIAEKVLAAFEQPIICNGHSIKTTPSIGIALYPQHGRDADSLIRNADIAMYHVKAAGRNSYRFYSFV